MDTMPTDTPASAKDTIHGISFALQLDRTSYRSVPPSSPIEATLTLRCERDTPLALSFSGQQFDLAIEDATGKQVALWSAGRVFPDYVENTQIGGERVWKATMPVPTVAPIGPIGVPTPDTATGGATSGASTAIAGLPGSPLAVPYTMTGYLVLVGAGASHRYGATVGFTVVDRPVLLDDNRN